VPPAALAGAGEKNARSGRAIEMNHLEPIMEKSKRTMNSE
jgi:hypothetical protein